MQNELFWFCKQRTMLGLHQEPAIYFSIFDQFENKLGFVALVCQKLLLKFDLLVTFVTRCTTVVNNF